MPDLLIINIDNSPHEKNDTIVVQPNNFEWGKKEYDLDIFRIISILDSDMSMDETKTWITTQVGYDTRKNVGGNPKLKYRAKTFDAELFNAQENAAFVKDRIKSVRITDNNGREHNTRSVNYDVAVSANSLRFASSMKPILT